jgi:hypothetical protein
MNDERDPLADELERFIAACQSDGAWRPPLGEPGNERAMAAALLDLADTLRPDQRFATELETRITATVPRTRRAGRGARPMPLVRHAPDVPRRNIRRWPAARSAIAAAVLLSLVLLAPQVRAAVQALWQLGAVHITRTEPTPVTAAGPTPTPLASVLDLAGQTTLSNARTRAGFPIRLPTYPPDLGRPDLVYLQDLNGPLVVLVWLVPGHPDQVRLSLHELSSGVFVYKVAPPAIQTTTVHGQPALWTDGPYLVVVRDGSTELRRLVTGHVLIWTEGGLTYRLETSVSLSDAVRIAASLR